MARWHGQCALAASLSVFLVLLTSRCAARAGSFEGSLGQETVIGSLLPSQDGTGAWQFVQGVKAGSVATAKYVDALTTTSGFGQLHIRTSHASDRDQMYAAGFLEGYLTAERIYDYFDNTHTYFLNQLNASLAEPMEWLEQQDAWAHRKVAEQTTPYYQVLGLVMAQLDGLVDGYQARHRAAPAAAPYMSRRDFIFCNGNGELYDLIERGPQAMEELAAMSGHELYMHVALDDARCSALITVSPDLSELLVGHSTWDSYTQIVRIFKHFQFDLAQPGLAAQRFSYSSYPGELFSDDDLYMMDSGLTVVSTTNKLFNTALYDQLTPESLVSWQRVRVANALARSGEEWTEYLRVHQSGTYNNQYMVIDVGRFVPGEDLPSGLLWVAEQIPGLIVAADMTDTLARGYFAAYNIPVFPEVYNASGLRAFQDSLAARGAEFQPAVKWLSYQMAPRAELFRRDHSTAHDLAGMRRLMRSNTFLTQDQLSGHNPMAAVCARGDLDATKPVPKGCFDTKVTSATLALRLEADVIAGPTTQDGLPPFRWTSAFEHVKHRGQPEVFEFDFERQAPETSTLGADTLGAPSAVSGEGDGVFTVV